MTARVGDFVTLTLRSYEPGCKPEAADILRTKSGRSYLILSVRGRRLECVVVPPDAVTSGSVYEWRWAAR
jgi:hypothetical protein